jgi:hypothetical protein
VNAAKSDMAELMDPCGIAFTMEDSSKGIAELLGINTPVINIGGCPAHPDWVFLTIGAAVLGKIKVPDDLPMYWINGSVQRFSSRLTMLSMITVLVANTMTGENLI